MRHGVQSTDFSHVSLGKITSEKCLGCLLLKLEQAALVRASIPSMPFASAWRAEQGQTGPRNLTINLPSKVSAAGGPAPPSMPGQMARFASSGRISGRIRFSAGTRLQDSVSIEYLAERRSAPQVGQRVPLAAQFVVGED